MNLRSLLILVILGLPVGLPSAWATDLALQEEQALQLAAQHVADSVVQIRTVGGLDRVGGKAVPSGPTTGLIITSDGYLISSAYNFAQRPSSILVRLAGGEQVPAELVARDRNRMLVLLKVQTDSPLPVPEAVPRNEIRVGQWSVAVGRTFRAEQVGVSVGIVSALNRMYGRVVQTDANVSSANYGGPLIDIQGRVIGVLTPFSPQSTGEQNEVAGSEFYDSGIGFAVPLEHILQMLPRMQGGEDLLPGKLGIGLKSGSAHVEPPEITTVWRGSPAAEAGWQAEDVVTAINGKPIRTQAQLRFEIQPRYAGDEIEVTVRRGKDEETEEITHRLTLVGELESYRNAFLGILPLREATEEEPAGIVVRAVWPESPAEQAGIAAGDKLIELNDTQLDDMKSALKAVTGLAPDQSVVATVVRGEEELELTVELSTVPEEILSVASLPPRQETTAPAELKLKPLKMAEIVQVANYYAPPQTEKRPRGMLLWLANGSAAEDQQLAEAWQSICDRDDLLLVVAHAKEESGWAREDLQFLSVLLRTVANRFDLDPYRRVVCGGGKSGQLAYRLAFNPRSQLTGVVSLDAPLPRTLRLPQNLPGGRLSTLAIVTPGSTFMPLVRKNIEELRAAGYPTSWWQRAHESSEPAELDDAVRETIARWVDGLDRF